MLTAYLLGTPGIQHPPGILELLSYSNFLIGSPAVMLLSTTKSGTREQGTRPAQPRGHAAATTMRKASVFAEIFASLTTAPTLLCWRMLVARWGLMMRLSSLTNCLDFAYTFNRHLRCLAISLPQHCQILIFPCPLR